MDQNQKVFVYGTLKRGHANHARFGDTIERIYPARLDGYYLVDCGIFPGALPREDGVIPAEDVYVYGEVIDFRDPDLMMLAHLDWVEALYHREMVPVTRLANRPRGTRPDRRNDEELVVEDVWVYILDRSGTRDFTNHYDRNWLDYISKRRMHGRTGSSARP